MKTFLRRAVLATALLALSAGVAGAQSNDGRNRQVTIVNGSHAVMYSFFASSSATTNWGQDRLGTSVLQPGQSVTWNFDDGTGACEWDFKATLTTDTAGHNPHEVDRRSINVCQIGTYTFVDD